MTIAIRNLEADDWPVVSEIYQKGIETGNATFETSVPDWDTWDRRHLKFCRIAAVENKEVIGWAALLPVSERVAYKGVAEVSVYVLPQLSGKGIGKKLLSELINKSEANGIWAMQASIFPENLASIRLHESCGFRVVGYREKIGKLNGAWRDTIIMERRSKVSGL